MIEVLYFIAVSIALYWLSDRILNFLEVRRGRRFDHRSLVFFLILLTLAVSSFWLIRQLTTP